jgi:hypothetical protein
MYTFYGSSKAFVKEVLAEITDQPHYNTLSTIVSSKKKVLFLTMPLGNMHQYYPIVVLKIIESALYRYR